MNSVVTAYPDALPEATSISLSLPESMTFEQWEAIGAELANRAKKLNWWIGDWWAAGHHRYGERARLAARGLFGKEFKTLANIASVCRAFEPTRRREHLSWSHHAEAAALSPNAADMLLDLAERDRMSKAQVRAAVTTIRGTSAPRPDADQASVATIFRTYNRLPGELRIRVAQAFAVVAASGAEIEPATGEPKAEAAHQPDAVFELADEPGEQDPLAFALEPEMVVDAAPDTALELELDTEFAEEPEPETETEFESELELETELELESGMLIVPEPGSSIMPDTDMVVMPNRASKLDETFELEAEMVEVPAPEPEPEPEPEQPLVGTDMVAIPEAEPQVDATLELGADMVVTTEPRADEEEAEETPSGEAASWSGR